MSDNFHDEYVECPKCEHQNPLNLSKCEICGYKLKKDSVSTIAFLGVSLALIGILGGGYFSIKDQFFTDKTVADSTVTEDVNRRASGKIKVLGDTFSGYSTLRSTALQEALKKSGITLQYADEFDQAQRAKALNQGQADLMVTTLDQFLQHKPQGKIVALIDRTVGADAIVLNTSEYPQLKSLIDLEKLVKQKQSQGQRLKIVFAGDTPSEFLATVLDTKFDNFDLADFEVVRVNDASEAWQQMQAPQSNIALAVLWEPFVTAASKQGNTILLSSADAPKVIVDVAIASESLLQSNPQIVQEFVENYYRRIDSSIQNQAILTRQIAEDGNLNDSEATAVVEGIQFFTSVEAQDWMTSTSLDKRIGAIAGILALSGRIDEIPPDFQALYTADFIKSAATKTNKLIEMVSLDNPELAKRLKGTSVAASNSNAKVSEAQVKKGADIGNVAVRGEVKFATGSAQLTEEGKRTLDKLAADIGEFNPTTIAIKVQGHTSKTGAANFNQKLSQNRASVVVSYLKQKQLSHKFLAEGLGFSQPLPGIDPSSTLNQRTVIRLVRLSS
ncbi:MAG: OmpA family protein [Xenococcus sp. MO_188.B8]|nr:OmpA family protein [Xenococcus sp. MO_188.B8]